MHQVGDMAKVGSSLVDIELLDQIEGAAAAIEAPSTDVRAQVPNTAVVAPAHRSKEVRNHLT